MLIQPPFSDQHIIDCLNTYYGIEVATLILLPLGADTTASVYKAKAYNQLFYFVKLKRGHVHEICITISELLHHSSIQQVISPIKTTDNQYTQPIDNFTLLVYPFIDGQNGFTRSLTAEQWKTLGKTLRKIHEIKVPSSIQRKIRRETYSPKWREIVRSLYTYFETERIGDEIALKLWAFMKKNTLTIHRLINRAEELATQILKNKSPKFVLCHSDIHAGNVLIDVNDTIYIVDWDNPIMAPKERDLMFIGGGVANVWNEPCEEILFYQGYGITKIDKLILAYYRHERIVEDIALYGQDLLLSAAGGENRLEMYNQFIAMFEPNGVVDMAFKTSTRSLASI